MYLKPKIISQIKINGEWVNQEDIPEEEARELIEKALRRAAANIGGRIERKTA